MIFDARVDSVGNAHPPLADLIEVGDCWTWQGFCNLKGYGRVKSKATGEVLAHRVFYTLLVGPIPDGLTLDHLCRNPPCVNPDHLEPVTAIANVARSPIDRRKRYCSRGHDTDVVGRVKRGCAECRRASSRDHQRKLRAEAKAAGMTKRQYLMSREDSA